MSNIEKRNIFQISKPNYTMLDTYLLLYSYNNKKRSKNLQK